MDCDQDRRVALLSIHPEFARAILQGDKKVELRRIGFAHDVSHVVMYATAPVQMVVGWFEVLRVDRDMPSRLWRRYRPLTGVTAERFRSYYEGSERGMAILVGETEELVDPVSLSTLAVDGPPQSFLYLGRTVLDTLAGVRDQK